jgi:hypothetical protein
MDPHDARRLREDPGPRAGQIVPAARGHPADRDDQRLLLAELHQLVPEQVGGERGAARRVDPQHDGLGRVVLRDLGDELAEAALGDAVATAEASRRPHRDRSDGAHDGDVRDAFGVGAGEGADDLAEAARLLSGARAEDDARASGAGRRLGGAARVVEVADLVDEPRCQRGLRRVRAVLDDRLHRLATTVADRLNPRLAKVGERALDRLARLGARLVTRVRLLGALVFADLEEVDADPELVEQRAPEHQRERDPDRLDAARGAQPDLGAALRGEHHRGVVQVVRVTVDLDAAILADARQALAEIERDGEPHAPRADPDEHALRVVVEVLDRLQQIGVAGSRHGPEERRHSPLAEALREVQLDEGRPGRGLALDRGAEGHPSFAPGDGERREGQERQAGRRACEVSPSHDRSALLDGRPRAAACGPAP